MGKIKKWLIVFGFFFLVFLLIGFVWILDEIKNVVNEYCLKIPFENTSSTKTPKNLGFEEISIEVDPKVIIKSWYIPSKIKNLAIILIPGYGATKEVFLDGIDFLHQNGYSLILFDPRGQGESSGLCGCGGFLAHDIEEIINFFAEEKGIEKFVLFGFSLGGNAAIVAGSRNSKVIGVIEDSGFANFRLGLAQTFPNHAKALFSNPFLYKLLEIFVPLYLSNFGIRVDLFEETDALKVVQNVKNILIIHGTKDSLIPFDLNAKILFEKAKETAGIKRLFSFDGDHCEGFQKYPEEYKKTVLEFLEILEG